MITDDQITALAREYAEWVTNVPKAKELPNCLLNEANTLIADDAERMLTWLSYRFYLVEKGAVKEQYKDAQKDQHNPKGDFALSLAGRNRSAVLIELFPEIAKETSCEKE